MLEREYLTEQKAELEQQLAARPNTVRAAGIRIRLLQIAKQIKALTDAGF